MTLTATLNTSKGDKLTMDYIFLFCNNKHQEIAEICIKSIYKACPYKTVLFYGCMTDMGRIKDCHKKDIRTFNVPINQFDKRIATCKIECLQRHKFRNGDRVICMDVDTIVQSDPFMMFEENPYGDAYVTKRHYEFIFPVNGGVFGFNMANKGQRALDWYNYQVHHKTWQPYRKFMINTQPHLRHIDSVNWYIGQDLLCVMYNERDKMPEDIVVVDAGPKYNYCPDYGVHTDLVRYNAAVRQVRNKLGNPEYRILHCKSHMKKELPILAKELGLYE